MQAQRPTHGQGRSREQGERRQEQGGSDLPSVPGRCWGAGEPAPITAPRVTNTHQALGMLNGVFFVLYQSFVQDNGFHTSQTGQGAASSPSSMLGPPGRGS